MLLNFVIVTGLLTLFCLALLLRVVWSQTSALSSKMAPNVAIVALPLVAFSCLLYGFLGSPDMPDAPFDQRVSAVPLDALPPEALAALAEIHLIENPTDAQGWRQLAPLYLSIGNYRKAVQAYDYALSLGNFDNIKDHALLEEGLGVSLYELHGKILLPSAEEHLEKAILLDPRRQLSVFLLTQGDLKSKRHKHAIVRLENLRERLPSTSASHQYFTQILAEIQR